MGLSRSLGDLHARAVQFFELMTAVTREIAQKYDVDGIFTNRWEGSGMCYCEHCVTNFRKATGDLHYRDPARFAIAKAYSEWKENRLLSNGISGMRRFASSVQSTVHREFGRRSVSRIDMVGWANYRQSCSQTGRRVTARCRCGLTEVCEGISRRHGV